jgi:hypothetical protein
VSRSNPRRRDRNGDRYRSGDVIGNDDRSLNDE